MEHAHSKKPIYLLCEVDMIVFELLLVERA